MRVLIASGVAIAVVLSGCGGGAADKNNTTTAATTKKAADATTVKAADATTVKAADPTTKPAVVEAAAASEGVMLPALVGFAAGASVVGLGAAVMRRKVAALEEPLVA